MQELRAGIAQRDNSLQKFVKLNGSLVQNPKEDPYTKVVVANFEKAQILQEEKLALVTKAEALVSLCNRFNNIRSYVTVGTSCHAP